MSASTSTTERNEPVLWTASFVLVLAVHAGLIIAVLAQSPPTPEGLPSDAITIDLSLEPSTVSTNADEAAIAPPTPDLATSSTDPVEESQLDLPAADAPPPTTAEPPRPEPRADLPPDPPPTVEAPVPLPQSPERPKPVAPVDKAPPVQQTTPSEARPKPAQAAAGGGRPAAARIATWKSNLALHLARNKRYPADAQARRQQGTTTIRFAVNRAGRVVSKSVVRSSGIAALDQESLALIQRAQPLPAPPTNMPDPTEITVPVRFSFR